MTKATQALVSGLTPQGREDLLKACDDSIAHWQRMHDNPRAPHPDSALKGIEGPFSDHCALCRWDASCNVTGRCACFYCPVRTESGARACADTPWGQAHACFALEGEDFNVDAWRVAAQAEINWLQQVRQAVALALAIQEASNDEA